jgi:hypothetical protein
VNSIPLVSFLRARPILLAWAESIGELDVSPLATPGEYVYFTVREHEYVKVGWTKYPASRPFLAHRAAHFKAGVPTALIEIAGANVERVVKRTARRFALPRVGWPRRVEDEFFRYDSPIIELVTKLRDAATDALSVNADSYPIRAWVRDRSAA